jgi:hypothetical protein
VNDWRERLHRVTANCAQDPIAEHVRFFGPDEGLIIPAAEFRWNVATMTEKEYGYLRIIGVS